MTDTDKKVCKSKLFQNAAPSIKIKEEQKYNLTLQNDQHSTQQEKEKHKLGDENLKIKHDSNGNNWFALFKFFILLFLFTSS